MESIKVLPGVTLVTFSALILFPFPLEGKYSTVSPSSRLSKSPQTSLRRHQTPPDLKGFKKKITAAIPYYH